MLVPQFPQKAVGKTGAGNQQRQKQRVKDRKAQRQRKPAKQQRRKFKAGDRHYRGNNMHQLVDPGKLPQAVIELGGDKHRNGQQHKKGHAVKKLRQIIGSQGIEIKIQSYQDCEKRRQND